MIRGHTNFISGKTFKDNVSVAQSVIVTGLPVADWLGRPVLAAGASITIITDRPSSVLVYASTAINQSAGFWVDQTGTGTTSFTALAELKLLSMHVVPLLSVFEKNEFMDKAHPLETRPAEYGHTFGFAIDPTGYSIARPVQNTSLLIAMNRQNYAIHHIKEGEVFIQDPTYGNTNQRSERIDYNTLLPFDTDCWWAFWWYVAPGAASTASNAFAICGQVFGTADAGETFARGPILRNLLYKQPDGSETWSMVSTYDTAATSTAASPLQSVWQVPLVRGQWHWQVTRFRLSRSGGGFIQSWYDGVEKFNANRALGFNDVLGPHVQQGIYKAFSAADDLEVRFANLTYGTTDLSHWVTSPPPIA